MRARDNPYRGIQLTRLSRAIQGRRFIRDGDHQQRRCLDVGAAQHGRIGRVAAHQPSAWFSRAIHRRRVCFDHSVRHAARIQRLGHYSSGQSEAGDNRVSRLRLRIRHPRSVPIAKPSLRLDRLEDEPALLRYLSTSPITISIDPMIAGTSASNTLRHNSPITARFTNEGPRIFTR